MQYEFCFRNLSYLFRQEKDLTALALSMSSRRRRHPRCPWRLSSRRRRHPRCPSSLFRFRPNKISSLRRSKLVTYSVNNSFCKGRAMNDSELQRLRIQLFGTLAGVGVGVSKFSCSRAAWFLGKLGVRVQPPVNFQSRNLSHRLPVSL